MAKNLSITVTILVAFYLIIGCGRIEENPLVPASPLEINRSVDSEAYPLAAHGFLTLYNFKPKADGAQPSGDLVPVDTVLYGTTLIGGAHGYGTVYSITRSGNENVLYSFKGGNDGAYPAAGLIYKSGVLYGTTSAGGASCNCGTVFKITPSGTESILYRFQGDPDAQFPESPLVAVAGDFYGTTTEGGGGSCLLGSKRIGCGAVFKISSSYKETIIYAFRGPDGIDPSAGLTEHNGVLYGTTLEGGGKCGCGTVFGVTKNQLKMTYDFTGAPDGALPKSSLVESHGNFYGTTYAGGETCHEGCGTVFEISPSGLESVLYRFQGGSDGMGPQAALTISRGRLYGTTSFGGGSATCGQSGCGTIFATDASGSEAVLYSFSVTSPGAFPSNALARLKRSFYGTTSGGGNSGCGQGSFPFDGCGTVFSFTP